MAGQLLLQAGDTILWSNPQKLANGVHIASSQIEFACVGKFNQCIQNFHWGFKILWSFHWKEINNHHLISNPSFFPVQCSQKKCMGVFMQIVVHEQPSKSYFRLRLFFKLLRDRWKNWKKSKMWPRLNKKRNEKKKF